MKPIQSNLEKILSQIREPGISTGISRLDDFIYGFRKKNLIVIGGASSMGKTSLMTDHIIAASKEVGVGVFSIEMGTQQIVDRMVYNLADLNYHRCQKTKTKKEEELLTQAKAELKSLNPIFFSETTNCMYPDWALQKSNPKDSIEVVLSDMYDSGARIFFIDYLQLIRWGSKSESETLRIKEITNKLHSIAVEKDVPIVLLSQLTKAAADRANKKDMDPTPTLSDLRDSGYIINDADTIILIHRPEYYKKKKESLELLDDLSEDAQLIVSKQRNGPTGVVTVTFRSYSMSFRDGKGNKYELF
jgi:replicative DNA helicase